MNVGTKVKLNPEIFPENKRKIPSYQAGTLNYFALMLDWEMEVVGDFYHSTLGPMKTLKILNIDAKNTVDMVESDLIVQGE